MPRLIPRSGPHPANATIPARATERSGSGRRDLEAIRQRVRIRANTGAGAWNLLRAALGGFTSLCLAISGPAAAGDVYALVIGVDDYAHINPLMGAVNDARDVSDALASIAARDVRVLMDGEATREAIFRNWSELSEAAGTGDTLIFHYAGHGGRQDAILEGHEAKDNMFLLAGFDDTGPGTQHRIVDNEIGHLLAEEEEATVLFVADSCFAGGMTRSIDGRVPIDIRTPGVNLRVSRAGSGGIEGDDTVAARVEKLGEVGEDALSRVIWLYAQDKNKVTQEIAVDGQRRGALSYAFAQALRGEGDLDGDGRLDVPELKKFVNRKVARLSERRQRPEVNAGAAGLSIALARSGPKESARFDVPRLRIHYPDGRVPFELRGVTEVADSESADIVYAAVAGVLIYRTGDVVAEFDLSESDADLASRLQGAVDKWRFIDVLLGLDTANNPALSLKDGDRVYREGEPVEFSILSTHHSRVTLFNLAYDGTVQHIAPQSGARSELFAGRLRIGQRTGLRLEVVPPFGADHLVAITTEAEIPELADAVFAADGKRDVADLAQDLARILHGTVFGIDWVGLYTQP